MTLSLEGRLGVDWMFSGLVQVAAVLRFWTLHRFRTGKNTWPRIAGDLCVITFSLTALAMSSMNTWALDKLIQLRDGLEEAGKPSSAISGADLMATLPLNDVETFLKVCR
jgi:hypothetical protein